MHSRIFFEIFSICIKVFSIKHLTFLKIYCKIETIEKIISRVFIKIR